MNKNKKTHRVRIVVLIDKNGTWACYGYGKRGKNESDKEIQGTAWDCLDSDDPHVAVHFVSADVPLPEIGEVEGSVTP